jgi:hypothetical protein
MKPLLALLLLVLVGCDNGQHPTPTVIVPHAITLAWDGDQQPCNIYVNDQIAATTTNTTCVLSLQSGDTVFVESQVSGEKSNIVTIK